VIGDHAREAFRDAAQLNGRGLGITAHEVPFDVHGAERRETRAR